jgi:hypothetical protein
VKETRAMTKATMIPMDFAEEVQRAAEAKDRGDLALLAEEATRFPWAHEGLRLIDRAQASLPRHAAEQILLFTGHRVDDADRVAKGGRPRFPPDKEDVARQAIDSAIGARIDKNPQGQAWVGISGAASGGDILFLEACQRRGIFNEIDLIIPRDDYERESVASSGGNWVKRYRAQLARRDARVREFQTSEDLPDWLREAKDYSVWERSNAWMLQNALARGGKNVALIALWDGSGGDGPGGTQHMFDLVEKQGSNAVQLDTKILFQ